ncbi:hypothetical protein HHI36_005800 [Cryptolaemus montrouzieri]|uniref:Uncharacterized protein n=1 Tax=Cryptolaemus montrouzieri TaxID=559131 RepID=A0ABD2NVH0_9CUCU
MSNFDFRYPFSTSYMEHDQNEKKKKSKKRLKQDSIAYKRHRVKANARKRKFLNRMTPEQKETERLKDREYYQKKKAENKGASSKIAFRLLPQIGDVY